MSKDFVYIETNRLSPGMFIDLELGWTEHPFLFPRFRLKSRQEIRQVQALGLQKIKVILKKSKADALETLKKPAPLKPPEESAVTGADRDLWEEKKASLNRAEEYKREHRRTVQQYRETQKRIGNLTRNLKLAPANAVRDADEVIREITGMLGSADSVVVSMINLTSDEFTSHHHALNVTVLALALGKHLNLSEQELHDLGVGCILHDIGKVMLPQQLLMKSKLTAAEKKAVLDHVGHGLKMLSRLEMVSDAVREIVAQHHAFLDGTGHPSVKDADDVSDLCRIAQIANHYDNMCNPVDVRRALSPKVAMATLFSKFETKLDSKLIHHFVRHLGVYPPGTVVMMSDDSTAVVTSVSSRSLLEPRVLIYNPDIPAKQALMIDLAENDDLTIRHALKPGEYPKEVQEYLGLEDRLGYFLSKP